MLDRPWAVLSAGVPFDEFTKVLQVAFDEGGASGFIAGRSVWRESLQLSGAEREQFLVDVARPRLERLIGVATDKARPWTEFAGVKAVVSVGGLARLPHRPRRQPPGVPRSPRRCRRRAGSG